MEKEQNIQTSETQSLDIVSGSCFWGHRWIKWVQYTQPMITRSGQNFIEYRQRRTCIRCGKMQDKLVS